MTLDVSIKINDGIVLASDSATTFKQGPNSEVAHVYKNANKVFNLHKKLPVGIFTYGLANIGDASIGTLIKDFRADIMNEGPNKTDVDNYSIKELSEEFYKFIFDKYNSCFQKINIKPFLGFQIAGYGSNKEYPEIWEIQLPNNPSKNPSPVLPGKSPGACWRGQPEAVIRLVKGYDINLKSILIQAGIDEPKSNQVIDFLNKHLEVPMIEAAMPIKDAIDLAEFYIETTKKYIKFSPGAQTVGGPIEIAAITKHEGFKWIKRKLYFDKKYNE